MGSFNGEQGGNKQMEFITKKEDSVKKRIIRFDEREILVLREAQQIAENIQIFVDFAGENEHGIDEKSIINMKAANIEYGINGLLA